MKEIEIKKKEISEQVIEKIVRYGGDILENPVYQSQKNLIHHAGTSIFEHCLNVACLSVSISLRMHLKVDYQALVRGALLHDFFLYDWKKKRPITHSWSHPYKAAKNAEMVFGLLTKKEKDIITKHMFPACPFLPPLYRESWIVDLADDISAVRELNKAIVYAFEKLKIQLKLRQLQVDCL